MVLKVGRLSGVWCQQSSISFLILFGQQTGSMDGRCPLATNAQISSFDIPEKGPLCNEHSLPKENAERINITTEIVSLS